MGRIIKKAKALVKNPDEPKLIGFEIWKLTNELISGGKQKSGYQCNSNRAALLI